MPTARFAAAVAAGLFALTGGGPAIAADARPPTVAASADARAAALADFDWVVAHVEANYAGWDTKTAGARRAEVAGLAARLRADVAGGGDLGAALSSFIAWFDDGHLQIAPLGAGGPDVAWRRIERRLDEAAARARLSALGDARAPIEGLWTIDDVYRLAVVRRDRAPGVFDAVVLSTTAERWRAGEVKATLTARPDGRFDVTYGTADRLETRFAAALVDRGATVETEGFGLWRRVFDDPAEARAAARARPGDVFAVERVDADTLLVRLPSFDLSHRATIERLMRDHADEIARTPNLIVDVRANGGGGDASWMEAFAPIQTRPTYRIGVEVRVSPANIAALKGILDQVRAGAPALAPVLEAQIARMEAAGSGYVPGEPHPFAIIPLRAVAAKPERVAVLIDGAASAAENFILAARQSRKVVLMGQANSAGVLDFGDMMSVDLPSGRFRLSWPTTRSLRVPLDPVDPDGIAPDVRIPADVADPIAWAAERLKRPTP